MNDSSSIEAFHDRKKLEHFCWKMDFVIDLKDELTFIKVKNKVQKQQEKILKSKIILFLKCKD